MATLRNKRKLAALSKEFCEEHPRNNLAQNSIAPRSQEDYITQLSDEIEGRVTKKLSQEFSRAENRILGALARLDDFFMNPLIQGYSGTAPETCPNALSTRHGTNEDEYQSDPHPEAGIFHNQMTQNSGPEDGHDRCSVRTETERMTNSSHWNRKIFYRIAISVTWKNSIIGCQFFSLFAPLTSVALPNNQIN